jgi:signal transduction histidine kinase
LRWQIGGAGALALLGALLAIHFLSRRLSAPMERLVSRSAENETALNAANHDLQRAARFSADASHQLKTPLTVLRAGLEELLAHDQILDSTREELSELVLQTCRLNGVIETLLLLSRVDAGRLRLEDAPVDLNHVIAMCLDDLSALPDSLDLEVETSLPEELWIAGEIRYTALILQNLLENALKYNRPKGRIAVTARLDGITGVALRVGNTGPGVAAAAQESIFERFHRGVIGENIPGHGLGLNLARELARLHGGELRLVCSGADWTEFEATFRLCAAPGARGELS